MSTIVWFKQDLRIEDNPALFEACKRGSVCPLFILDNTSQEWAMGGAAKWWLHFSLESLREELATIKLPLVIRLGNPLEVLTEIIKDTKATAVYWNRCYEPQALARDATIKRQLSAQQIEVQSFNANLLYEPWTIANKQGKPFKVFTPFWNACQNSTPPPAPLAKPHTASSVNTTHLASEELDTLKLLPKIHWDSEIKKNWQPGAPAALKHLHAFLKGHIEEYPEMRDYPASEGVSKLSPHLHFGEISPRMILQAIKNTETPSAGKECYIRQLGWREFAHHLLYHFPFTPKKPLRPEFNAFPWVNNSLVLEAWQKGLTGFPIVDAGMRQLWRTGWMHNRVRMIVGSFLVKDLLIAWQQGAEWFWDTLVDADLANNTLGWQWIGGCGADAAPYFRIFNPTTQSENFDSKGEYIKKWVPELAHLPEKWIHCPSEAPELILRSAGIRLGVEYPYPIVDHSKARLAALNAFSSIKNHE